MIASPLFWEWFNLWLVDFLKDLYHEIKMVALRGNGYVPHGVQSDHYAASNGIGNGNGAVGSGQRVPMQFLQSTSKHEPPRYASSNNYRLLTQSRKCRRPSASSAGPAPVTAPPILPQRDWDPLPMKQREISFFKFSVYIMLLLSISLALASYPRASTPHSE